jgi:hypothetical protein
MEAIVILTRGGSGAALGERRVCDLQDEKRRRDWTISLTGAQKRHTHVHMLTLCVKPWKARL